MTLAMPPPTDPIENAIKALHDVRHQHTNFAAGLKLVNDCIALTQITKSPYSVIITGDSGLGKTSIAEEVLGTRDLDATLTHIEESAFSTFRSVSGFYVRVPPDCSPRALKIAMLKKLGVSHPKGTVSDLNEMLLSVLITSRVRVIIIDEVQQLLNKGSQKTHNQIRDWIKQLTDQTHIPIVLIGMPESYTLLKEDNQLLRRFPYHITFNHFEYDDTENSVLRRLLRSHYEKVLELTAIQQFPPIHSENLTSRLYAMTGGSICSLMLHLNHVVVATALRQGKTSISRHDLFHVDSALSYPGVGLLSPQAAGSLPISQIKSTCWQLHNRAQKLLKKYA